MIAVTLKIPHSHPNKMHTITNIHAHVDTKIHAHTQNLLTKFPIKQPATRTHIDTQIHTRTANLQTPKRTHAHSPTHTHTSELMKNNHKHLHTYLHINTGTQTHAHISTRTQTHTLIHTLYAQINTVMWIFYATFLNGKTIHATIHTHTNTHTHTHTHTHTNTHTQTLTSQKLTVSAVVPTHNINDTFSNGMTNSIQTANKSHPQNTRTRT
jgi:hypothetical protein